MADEVKIDPIPIYLALQQIQAQAEVLGLQANLYEADINAAKAGDPHGYLTKGLDHAYAAVSKARTVEAMLNECVNNARNTVLAFEKHDAEKHGRFFDMITATAIASNPLAYQMQAPPLPPGALPARMSDRHVLTNLNFFKAVKPGVDSGNTFLLDALSDPEFQRLYREAYAYGPQQGMVKLANGEIWYINKTTGKFFPAAGGSRIVNLTQQEVGFLRIVSKQVKAGTTAEQALANLGLAIKGQEYKFTNHFQTALEKVTPKLGASADDVGRILAPYLPATQVSEAATSAAQAKAGGRVFRFVKWGGRVFLVIGLAAEGYEIYHAENKAKTITTKVGAWSASLAASGAAAKVSSPLLAGGPWGWAGYGVVVVGSGIGGYVIGEEVTETVYEWVFEEAE